MNIKEEIKRRKVDIHEKTEHELREDANHRLYMGTLGLLLLSRGIFTLKKHPVSATVSILVGGALLYTRATTKYQIALPINISTITVE